MSCRRECGLESWLESWLGLVFDSGVVVLTSALWLTFLHDAVKLWWEYCDDVELRCEQCHSERSAVCCKHQRLGAGTLLGRCSHGTGGLYLLMSSSPPGQHYHSTCCCCRLYLFMLLYTGFLMFHTFYTLFSWRLSASNSGLGRQGTMINKDALNNYEHVLFACCHNSLRCRVNKTTYVSHLVQFFHHLFSFNFSHWPNKSVIMSSWNDLNLLCLSLLMKMHLIE